MRCIFLLIGLLAVLVVVVSQAVQSRSEPQSQAAPEARQAPAQADDKAATDRSADEAAIRANVAAFVRAYNAGDAKAVAALFAPDALIVDKEDDTSQGRAAIEQTFADLFAAAPQKRLEVSISSIRFIGPDLGVEVGTTKETPAPGETPDYDRYTVLHVKRDGKWLMALARDAEGEPPPNRERLRPLAWLVGEWVDDGGSVVVNSTCRWSEDGNFLLQEFNLQVEGQEAMRVSQRIGWDPLAKRIRSWVFDSEGGYGESVWTRTGDAWLIKATGVRSDGATASATNMLIPAGPDGYVWRSTDRIVGDEVSAPVEVKVVRKPPQPKQQTPRSGRDPTTCNEEINHETSYVDHDRGHMCTVLGDDGGPGPTRRPRRRWRWPARRHGRPAGRRDAGPAGRYGRGRQSHAVVQPAARRQPTRPDAEPTAERWRPAEPDAQQPAGRRRGTRGWWRRTPGRRQPAAHQHPPACEPAEHRRARRHRR